MNECVNELIVRIAYWFLAFLNFKDMLEFMLTSVNWNKELHKFQIVVSLSNTFYRAAECRRGLAMRILSVCGLSVCLSVKRMNCDKTEDQSVQIFQNIIW